MTVQQKIYDEMEKKNISQSQLSRETGIPVSTISAWKHKNSLPSIDKLDAIANCLGISIFELLHPDVSLSNNYDKSSTIVSSFVGNNIGDNNNISPATQEISSGNTTIFDNPHVTKAYNSLTEREKLEIQIAILDKAAASEKSNATVTEIKKEEASPDCGETSYK